MHKLFLIALIAAMSIKVNATIVYASQFGWNANDATSAFQSAVNSAADTIVINKQNGDWITGPNIFFDLSDKTLIFEPGVVFRAKAGAFAGSGDCLLKFVRGNNIKVIGYGATFLMNKAEYAAMADSEWRHSLSINNSGNIRIYGLKLFGSGGDGIDISGDPWYGEQLYSENIVLQDLWCNNHYRQGISVISAQHLLVKNCWFTNTSGTLPMSGVDLEPDKDFHRMADVVFEKCRFTGNYGNGIQLSFHNLTSASTPLDITFKECYSAENHDISNSYAAAEIAVTAAEREAVTGKVTFDRCLVENSQWTAVNIRKPADSYITGFNDCVFLNVSQNHANKYNTPIWIEVSDYSQPCPRFGGAEFNDCLLSYSTNLNFLGSYGEINTSPGMGNVKLNNLTVINPNSSVTMNLTDGGGSPDTTCIFDYKKYTSPPSTTVTLSAQNRIIECSGLNSTLESNRTSDNKSFPVAVSYLIDGTAVQGEDFNQMNGFMIIPSGQVSGRDTIYVLNDKSAEGAKCIITTLNTSSLFTSSSLPLFIFVYDCITGINDINADTKFTIFPNPAHDFIEIDFDEDYQGFIQVFSERGQLVLTQKANDKVNIIDVTGFSTGVYFIKIQIDNKIHSQKIIKL
jgi:hypothetical protein